MIKRNELLTQATTGVNFKKDVRSERSQKKNAYCMISFTQNSRRAKESAGTESRSAIA